MWAAMNTLARSFYRFLPIFVFTFASTGQFWMHCMCGHKYKCWRLQGGSRILQGQVSDLCERAHGKGSGRGLSRKIFVLYQNDEFLCIPRDIYWHCTGKSKPLREKINPRMFWTYIFFKKGTIIKRSGVRTPWTPSPGSATGLGISSNAKSFHFSRPTDSISRNVKVCLMHYLVLRPRWCKVLRWSCLSVRLHNSKTKNYTAELHQIIYECCL